MNRPFGVTVIALLVVGFSVYVLSRALAHAASQKNRPMFIVAGLLMLLAVVAGEALWSLRSHSFLVFMVWGLCAMVAVALVDLRSPAGAHAVRMMPTLVYTGGVLAGAALYLRRAV